MWGVSRNIYSVDSCGRVLKFDFVNFLWIEKAFNEYTKLNGIWGRAIDQIFITSRDYIYRIIGNSLETLYYDFLSDFTGICGTSEKSLFIVTDHNEIYFYDGKTNKKIKSTYAYSNDSLLDIWCSKAGDIYAVGRRGQILKYKSSLNLSTPLTVNESDSTLFDKGKVCIERAISWNLSVTLSSNDTSEIDLPPSIIIPKNSSCAFFDITVKDDSILDGTQNVEIKALISDLDFDYKTIAVHDNETSNIYISVPESVYEHDKMAHGQIEINQNAKNDILVMLTSNDTSEIDVQPEVIIPKGEKIGHFFISIIDDQENDGGQVAEIRASVENWTSEKSMITVIDNEPGQVSFEPYYTVYANSSQATITVHRHYSSSSDIYIDFDTQNGTAINGVDYKSSNGILNFKNGVKTQTFSINISKYPVEQPYKTVNLILHSSNKGLIENDKATLYIIDDRSTSWNSERLLDDTNNIVGICGEHNDIFAVGGNNIFHYTGISWTEMDLQTSLDKTYQFNNAWGNTNNGVYVVGNEGIILHYINRTWQIINTISDQNINSIWGDIENQYFAVGSNGTLKIDGKNWNQISDIELSPGLIIASLEDVFGFSNKSLFAVGYGHNVGHDYGVILQYKNEKWEEAYKIKNVKLFDIYGFSENSIFAVGQYNDA